jgi:peptidoglycan/LPS O-acetylase OafA/YrhL
MLCSQIQLAVGTLSFATIRSEAAKLAFIDACRGLAILLVIMVHTGLSVWPAASSATETSQAPLTIRFGQMGVQLFFVVSAFTLCNSWSKRREREREREAIRDFYIRRVFRIAPLYWIAIAIYSTAALARHTWGRGPNPDIDAIAANVFLVHSFLAKATNTVVPGGWSIATECTFYAIFPFAAELIYRRRSTVLSSLVMFAAAVICCQSVLYWIRSVGGDTTNNSYWYFSLLSQGPVFILGAMLYSGWKDRQMRGTVLSIPFALCRIAAWFALALWVFSISDPLAACLAPTIAAIAFCELTMLMSETPSLSPLWLRKIGQLSYSIYVFHWIPAVIVGSIVAPILSDAFGLPVTFVVIFVFTVLVSMVVARFSQRYVESPMIGLGNQLVKYLRSSDGRS